LSLLSDLTLQAIFSRLFGVLFFCAVHGGLLTLFAQLLRRPDTPYKVSFSANPFTHLSLPAVAMAVFFRTAWIRYQQVGPETLKGGRWALVGIVLASLALTLAIVPLIDMLRPFVANVLPRTVGYAVLQGIVATQQIIMASVLFNLLPLPGLTGGMLLVAAFPQKARQIQRAVVPVYAVIVIALVAGWWPDLGPALAPYLTR
jgi:Zn-dependent protease